MATRATEIITVPIAALQAVLPPQLFRGLMAKVVAAQRKAQAAQGASREDAAGSAAVRFHERRWRRVWLGVRFPFSLQLGEVEWIK